MKEKQVRCTRVLSPSDFVEFKRLQKLGWSLRALAHRFGISVGSACEYSTGKKHPYTDEELKKMDERKKCTTLNL